ncbi:hypothetical protein RND81_10G121700 [Saponaria officinalis]|uniref:non-specific serine/threonine protein kinase n=1 Tax=Saponaria officinalis TaxID=3572 RepID=A0AAW1I3N9_SAPOF
MERSVLYSFFFMSFIFPLIITRNKFVKADSEEYEECKKPFLCGDKQVNLSYPFYDGQGRPAYCGYPGFKIDCSHSFPEISMSSETYYLLSTNTTSGVISVAVQNYYDGSCPQNMFNIDTNLYKYASTNDKVTLFYDCPIGTVGIPFPCTNASSDNNNNNPVTYYLPQNFGSNLSVSCQNSVVVPTQLSPGSQPNQNIINNGFELEWIADKELCDGCHKSGGECGSNAGLTKFTCYCPDGSHDSDCNGNDSSKSKTGVIIGVIVGVSLVAALLAGCLFMMRRRKRRIMSRTRPKDDVTPASMSTDLPSSNEFQSSQDYTTSSSTYVSQSMPSYPSSKSNRENDSGYHGVKLFSYDELEEATGNFNESRELGDGGFGAVYYGMTKTTFVFHFIIL